MVGASLEKGESTVAQSYKLFTGQIVGLTTTPTQLAVEPQASIREVLVQSDPGNSTNVNVGSGIAQYVVLAPGQSISLPLNALSTIWVKMVSSTGTVNWLGRD